MFCSIYDVVRNYFGQLLRVFSLLSLLIVVFFVSDACADTSTPTLAATRLRCEYLENPLGIDEIKPRLNWQVESSERGQRQTSCQILVASSEENLKQEQGDLWNSGRIPGQGTLHVVCDGLALSSGQHCFWKVKVWDKDGKPSAWSESAMWSMGLLKASDWSAQWISFRDTTPVHKNRLTNSLPPAHYYRRPFETARPIRRATVYATALGLYELHINGRRVGDAWFTPGWSDYHQRVYYNTYDVTEFIKPGTNVIAAIIADGWYSGYLGFGLATRLGPNKIGRYLYGKTPALLAQLEIDYPDGTKAIVNTDQTWKVTDSGPIREADIQMGEFYDARMELSGWDKQGCDDKGWLPTIRAEENGSTRAPFYDSRGTNMVELGFQRPRIMEAYPSVPVRMIQEIKPIAVTSPTNGVYIFNLGQNFAGVARLKVRGEKGTRIRLRYGEMLHPDGTLMTENLRRARAHDYYILNGNPEGETYTPRFTFHGFQYVEVTGYPGKPDLDAITGMVIHSDTPPASDFTCSDPMVNQLFRNIVWTQRANFLEVPMDCPQRDERLGWTADAQVYARSATCNADTAAFYTKWLRDLEEAQRPSGAFPPYAPFPMQNEKDFASGWMEAGIICPYTIYQVYGDKRIIERHYDSMKRFMEFRKRNSKNFLSVEQGNLWGDWLALKEMTPVDLIDAAYYAYSARLMAEMAHAIGNESDSLEYARLFEKTKAAFQKKFLKRDGELSVNTQAAYALAINLNLLPDEVRTNAGARLAERIRKDDLTIGTGILGTRALLPALSVTGQNDLAVRLLQSRKHPSWGYEVEQGATTVWERWDGFDRTNGFGSAGMNSFAHCSFGAVCEWMFLQLAGIDTDGAGFKHIMIRPSLPAPGSNPDNEPITWVRAYYDSVRGRIVSNWKLDTNHFELEVTIPANTTATVYLPARNAAEITEGNRALKEASGIRFLRMEDTRAVLAVQSGSYHFISAFGPLSPVTKRDKTAILN
ncbi:MAG: Bacterial alpha-L-rhamnosidase [Pedosphaera sp.]|nr:Bacterial alpha-L-rhamnosidase [Pedosphaera sp.]